MKQLTKTLVLASVLCLPMLSANKVHADTTTCASASFELVLDVGVVDIPEGALIDYVFYDQEGNSLGSGQHILTESGQRSFTIEICIPERAVDAYFRILRTTRPLATILAMSMDEVDLTSDDPITVPMVNPNR